MATGTGLDGQVGAKKETGGYGVRAVPNQFFLFDNEAISLDNMRTTLASIGAGNLVQKSALSVVTGKDPSGTLAGPVLNQGHGLFFDLLHGNTVTPVQQGATTAYLQTHNIGQTPITKSLTLQVGRPSTDGTINPFDYLGGIITAFQFSIDTGGVLTFQYTFVFQDEQTNQTLAVKSIQTGIAPYNHLQCALKFDGTMVADIYSATISGTLPARTDRRPLNASGLRNQPLTNGLFDITGSLNGEYRNNTNYGRYTGDTRATVVLEATGAQISGAYNYLCRFTLDTVSFEGATPNVGGPDMVMQDLPIRALAGASNPPLKIEYMDLVSTVL